MKENYYYINTYGCQMNVHESEKIAGMLENLGYFFTNDIKKADIIVFNTCCIRDGAEQKIYAHIGNVKNLKKIKKELIVVVCGCMTQADNRSEIISSKFPYVNIIIGTHNIHKLKEYILDYKLTNKKIIDVWQKEDGIFENIETKRDSNINAWVNISFGCNNFCTYCIVPYVRGSERSRNITDIVNEVECLVKKGYKYITLLGQNVNSYGNDINDSNITFANLLDRLCEINGDFKIKFLTSHPKDLSDEVINTIKKNSKKICNIIHLPVQSGSNKILKLMNRNYTREHYIELIKKIRNKLPDCYISTDIIVGFPDETEQDFLDTVNLVKEIKFDGVFAFMYSVRSGTVAEKMNNHISNEVKNFRVNELLKITKNIVKLKNLEVVNKIFNGLIIEKITENSYKFETDCGKIIEINDENNNLSNDKFYNVKIIKVLNNKLFGTIVN